MEKRVSNRTALSNNFIKENTDDHLGNFSAACVIKVTGYGLGIRSNYNRLPTGYQQARVVNRELSVADNLRLRNFNAEIAEDQENVIPFHDVHVNTIVTETFEAEVGTAHQTARPKQSQMGREDLELIGYENGLRSFSAYAEQHASHAPCSRGSFVATSSLMAPSPRLF